MKNEVTLGRRIHRLRLEAGLSAAELGRRVGVSDVTISHWESGRVRQFKHGHLLSVCGVFGITVSEMIDDPLYVDAKAALRDLFDSYKELADLNNWGLEDTPEGKAAMKVLGIES